MISLLVAMDKNNVIGKDNDLPWYLPRDLKFFKELTIERNVIMGRKTYDSIGKPLPNRRNIVITSKDIEFPEGVEVVDSLEGIYELNEKHPEEEWFVIGGGEIFRQILAKSDRLYITKIEESFDGDTFFPPFDEDEWHLTSNVQGERDENNPYEYYFLQYDRKQS
ncbi:MAG TPA: dihydrofolate reductase [Pseudogracilibacillus sp.]|nr:dihydrofolate reductase [Pseudogracilibacillus sp.]